MRKITGITILGIQNLTIPQLILALKRPTRSIQSVQYAALTLTEVKLIWLMYAGEFFNPCFNMNEKNFPKAKDDFLCQIQKFQVCKLSMMVMTLKTRSGSNFLHAIKGLVIMHLGFKVSRL